MSLNKYMIIFLIIVLSMFFVDNIKIDTLQKAQYERVYLENVIDNALIDAANAIRLEGDQHGNLSSYGLDPMNVVNAMLDDISFSLGYHEGDLDEFKLYIPFMLVLDVDGFYIYKLDEFGTDSLIKHRLYQKEFFSYVDEQAMYGFDTEFNIKIFDKSDKRILHQFNLSDSSELSDLSRQFTFLNSQNLQKKIAMLMYDQLNHSIETAVNSHNSLASKKGVFYEFDWNVNRTEFDILRYNRAFAFLVQGLPIAGGRTFSYLKFNKLEIKEEALVYGFIKDGIRYYSKREPADLGFEVEEIFSSPLEAVKSGYFRWRE